MTQPYDQDPDNTSDSDEQRRPYRPPVGMPLRGEGRWGAPFSLAVHVVLVLLLITPLFARVVAPELFPGGGFGPAGGGGGGRGGTGGWPPRPITPEGLRYVRIAPEPPPAESAEPTTKPPEVVNETPPPRPDPPAEQPPTEQSPPAATAVPGTGGGTGNDGTKGTGPGTGGGVGSGTGTGTGSGDGPGTGGGAGRDYLPTPDFVVLAPDPPGRLRGTVVIVTFTLNERGDVLRVDFPSTGDRGYDRRLRERMNEMKFRPAVGPDGRPMAAIYPIEVRL